MWKSDSSSSYMIEFQRAPSEVSPVVRRRLPWSWPRNLATGRRLADTFRGQKRFRAAFGVALADPSRRTILITGEGSHQLTANDVGAMGRFGANVIVFVLNNSGYLIERALEENPNWTYNDLAPWNYAELPKALGCANWYTARVTTLGELDEAMKAARASKTGAYVEIIGGKMDMPPALAFAHGQLKAMYGDTP
jgi:indolepyruvate decarboxylase